MRKLKGGEEIPLVILAISLTVFFVVTVILSPFFLEAKTIAKLGVEKQKIQVVDFAHLAKKCFSEGGFVKEGLITKDNYIKCNFAEDIMVVFEDLETEEKESKKWTFGSKGGAKHAIFVSLMRNNKEVHIGELHVEL